jgi:hypothetical protein
MIQAAGTAKGPKELKPEEWITLRDHLTITFDHEKNRVEISWACNCGEDPCPHKVPKTPTLALYVCPSRPCPGH